MALLKPIFRSTFLKFSAITESRNLLNSIELIITSSHWLIFVVVILCTCSTHIDGAFFLTDPYEHPVLSQQDERITPATTTITTTATTPIQKILREKAKTFGQNAEEIQKVNYYLEKIQKFEAKQHPEEILQRYTTKLSGAVRVDIS